jgi:hypothetical protein
MKNHWTQMAQLRYEHPPIWNCWKDRMFKNPRAWLDPIEAKVSLEGRRKIAVWVYPTEDLTFKSSDKELFKWVEAAEAHKDEPKALDFTLETQAEDGLDVWELKTSVRAWGLQHLLKKAELTVALEYHRTRFRSDAFIHTLNGKRFEVSQKTKYDSRRLGTFN